MPDSLFCGHLQNSVFDEGVRLSEPLVNYFMISDEYLENDETSFQNIYEHNDCSLHIVFVTFMDILT